MLVIHVCVHLLCYYFVGRNILKGVKVSQNTDGLHKHSGLPKKVLLTFLTCTYMLLYSLAYMCFTVTATLRSVKNVIMNTLEIIGAPLDCITI